MNFTPDKPTPDDIAGMGWWNGLSKKERAHWANLAGSARPKDAWEAFKADGEVIKSDNQCRT